MREADRHRIGFLESLAVINRPQTVKPPSPSSFSPASRSRLATATTSPFHALGAPVGKLNKPAQATLMPSSRPIK